MRIIIPSTKRTLLHQLLRDHNYLIHTSTHKYHLYQCYLEQVTRGHNIVADRWAGAANPHSHPSPLPTQTHTQKSFKTLIFTLFYSCSQNNRPMDQRTDKASFRVACPQLKREGDKRKKIKGRDREEERN